MWHAGRSFQEGSDALSNEAPGDLCYYTPWGYLDGGVEPLLRRGKFPRDVDLS